MKGDVLTNAYLMNKLAKAQAELAQTVKSGSVPHPRRVMKEAHERWPVESKEEKKRHEIMGTAGVEFDNARKQRRIKKGLPAYPHTYDGLVNEAADRAKPKRRRRKKETESL